MAASKRRPDESYQQYKKRLKDEDQGLKRLKKGRVVWDQGTFDKTDFITYEPDEEYK